MVVNPTRYETGSAKAVRIKFRPDDDRVSGIFRKGVVGYISGADHLEYVIIPPGLDARPSEEVCMPLLCIFGIRVHASGNRNEIAEAVENWRAPVNFYAGKCMGMAAKNQFRPQIHGIMGKIKLVLVEEGLSGAPAVEIYDHMVCFFFCIQDVVRHIPFATGVCNGIDSRRGAARLCPVITVGGSDPDIGAAGFHNRRVAFSGSGQIIVKKGEPHTFSFEEGRFSRFVIVTACPAGGNSLFMKIFDWVQDSIGALIKAVVSPDGHHIKPRVLESTEIFHIRRGRGMGFHIAPTGTVRVWGFHVADGDVRTAKKIPCVGKILFRVRGVQDDISHAE